MENCVTGLNRRKITREFKAAAVRRLDSGASLAEAARACVINPKVLHCWGREQREFGSKASGRAGLLPPLAHPLWRRGSATGARPARTAGLLRFPKTPLAQATHHQHNRTLRCRGPPPYPTYGLFRQRPVRRPYHLLHTSTDSTWIGKTPPSALLQLPLDVTSCCGDVLKPIRSVPL